MTQRLTPDLCGKTLAGRYLVQQSIGVGGFARVYRATDTRLGNYVAIKVLHPEHTRNIADLERFRNEASLAGRINDDHFVRVTDFFQEREHFCFVMEHLEGLTLRDELKRLPSKIMSWPRAFKIARQVCAGLGVAHSRGLIHRDIKPENIFLKRPGSADQVKLLDLGVAKILEDHHWSGLHKNLSNTGDIIGSPCYIAPEQVKGEKSADARIDIYSLGIVLYEMVTGRVPFRGHNAYETLEHHVRTEPERPTAVATHVRVPRQIEDIILRALKKRPIERYRTAHEMDAAIRNELEQRSDERRVRSVQFIQVAPELALRNLARPPEPGAFDVDVEGTVEEPTTAKRVPRPENRVSVPQSRARVHRSGPLPIAQPPHAGTITQPADTDITPSRENTKSTTPKAQQSPTSPDIEDGPAAHPPAVALPEPRPLRLRTLVALGSFAAASLLATCSVSTVLAMAIDTRRADRPLVSPIVIWPSEPSEPPASSIPSTPPPLEQEQKNEDSGNELTPEEAGHAGEQGNTDDVGTAEPNEKLAVAGSESGAPEPPKARPKKVTSLPPKLTMAAIAKRAAAKIQKECRIAWLAGIKTANYSVGFKVDKATGVIEKQDPVGNLPTLADRDCVIRKVVEFVPDFKGATDLRSPFVYIYTVVR